MKRDNRFVLRDIEGIRYLFPVGQKMASFSGGLQLNDTGCYFWDLLKNEITIEEMVEKSRTHFNVGDDQVGLLAKDIKEFTSALKDRGMIEGFKSIFGCNCRACLEDTPLKKQSDLDAPDGTMAVLSEELNHYSDLDIAGIRISLYGDEVYFSKNLDAFKISDEGYSQTPDMRIEVINIGGAVDTDGYFDEPDAESIDRKTEADGEETEGAAFDLLIHHRELDVLEYENKYVLFLPETKGIYEVHLTKDASLVRFYCDDPDNIPEDTEEGTSLQESIFYGIRMVFLLKALYSDLIMLHSASILFENRAWLFSASSGTGKSTHCDLWKKVYDTPCINGDLNLLGVKDGKPVIYGTPWCGTSGIYDTATYPLGGIVLLKRGENVVQELSEDKKLLYVQQRLISPVWKEEMLDRELDILKRIIPSICVKRYFCNMEDDAAVVLHDSLT